MKNLNITLITGLVIILLTGFQNISYAQKGGNLTTHINTRFEVQPQNLQYKILSLDGNLFEDKQAFSASPLIVTTQTSDL